MVPLYTAVLSTEEYGISDMVNVIGSLMLPVLTLCISNAVLRFCFIKEFDNTEVLTIGHRIVLYGTCVSIVITSLLFFFRLFPQLGLYIWFVPFFFLFNSYSTLLSNYARGVGEVKLSAMSGVISTAVIILSNVLFLLAFKIGIIGYIVSFLIGAFISTIFIWWKLSIKERIHSKANATLRIQMIKFSLPLIPNDVSWWALDSFNRFFIISTLSVSAVGIFSASSRIPAILSALCGIFSQAWLLSALDGYGTEENKQFICSIHKKLFSLLSVMTALFIVLSKCLAEFLLSGDFSSCWYMIPFLMISVFMGAISGFYGSIYSAERKNSMQFISTLAGSIVSIVVMLVFLKKYGIIIAAISNMIGYIIIWITRKEGIKKYVDIGVSTTFCAIQLILLILEALAVSRSLWLLSGLILISLIFINGKELVYTVVYLKGILIAVIKKNRNG